jgi:DNA-binding NtrC family response regulator
MINGHMDSCSCDQSKSNHNQVQMELNMSEESLKPHILVVDDEENIRSALRRILRRDYQLSFAESGAQALELLKTQRPDVILSDYLMPEMTGLELLKRCRLFYPEMSRVVLTGQAEMQVVIAAINEGAVFRFLTKPWDEDELLLTMHMAVEHSLDLKAEQQKHSAQSASIVHGKATELKATEVKATPKSNDEFSQLEEQHPGLTQIKRTASGAIVIDEE